MRTDLTTCRVCPEIATVIISKNLGGDNRNSSKSVMFSYCEFHAIIAEGYFGQSTTRVAIKMGGSKRA